MLTSRSTRTPKKLTLFGAGELRVIRVTTMKHSPILYVSGVLTIFALLIAGFVVFRSDHAITVFDNRIKILDHSISWGTYHEIYHGNPALGRAKAKLKYQLGLKFIGPVADAVSTGQEESLAFILRYSGDFPFDELDGLKAVLTNDKNVSKELQNTNTRNRSNLAITKCYLLPPDLLTSDDNFRIDFRVKSVSKPIAAWHVGEFNKYSKARAEQDWDGP